MSSSLSSVFLLSCIYLLLSVQPQLSHADLVEQPPLNLTYHDGALLTGSITVNFIWYGNLTQSQRMILTDFITSISSPSSKQPCVTTWWKTLQNYYIGTDITFPNLTFGSQITDGSYSHGKQLNSSDLVTLAGLGPEQNAINVVVTAADVGVDGFCISRCGTHGSGPGSSLNRFTYIWVGNPATQCPGQCAWPFHQLISGPLTPALVSPNGDAAVEGMVVNLASLLAGTVTNPYGDGFFQGQPETPLEAATACPGIYGKKAFPGYAGDLLVDPSSKASYNANGARGRRFLVPALFDPTTTGCTTTV